MRDLPARVDPLWASRVSNMDMTHLRAFLQLVPFPMEKPLISGNFDPKTLKTALAYGTLTASFTVEDFSLDRLRQIKREDLDRRMEEYKRMLSF